MFGVDSTAPTLNWGLLREGATSESRDRPNHSPSKLARGALAVTEPDEAAHARGVIRVFHLQGPVPEPFVVGAIALA